MAKAKEMGASAVFNPLETRVPAQDQGADRRPGVWMWPSKRLGVEASLKDCLASTRYRGRVVVQGIFTDRVPIHMLGFVTREVTMIGTNSLDLEQAMEWIDSGLVEPEAMVTRIIPLAEIQTNGFDELTDPACRHVKVLVNP